MFIYCKWCCFHGNDRNVENNHFNEASFIVQLFIGKQSSPVKYFFIKFHGVKSFICFFKRKKRQTPPALQVALSPLSEKTVGSSEGGAVWSVHVPGQWGQRGSDSPCRTVDSVQGPTESRSLYIYFNSIHLWNKRGQRVSPRTASVSQCLTGQRLSNDDQCLEHLAQDHYPSSVPLGPVQT